MVKVVCMLQMHYSISLLQCLLEQGDCHSCRAGLPGQKPARSRPMLEQPVQLYASAGIVPSYRLSIHYIVNVAVFRILQHCAALQCSRQAQMLNPTGSGTRMGCCFIILLHCTLLAFHIAGTCSASTQLEGCDRCCDTIKHILNAHQTDLSIRGSIT